VARYNLALATYSMAMKESTNEAKMKYLGMAKKYITVIIRIYPDLGGVELTKRYDILLRKIQQALGEPTVGLKALQPETTVATPSGN
jgi:hypothetical protein